MTTKGQEAAADVAALLRARNALIWIVTREEARVELLLIEACAAANYVPRTWDVAQGFCDMEGKILSADAKDPADALSEIAKETRSRAVRTVTIMRDLPAWLTGPTGTATLRAVRNLARSLPTAPRDNANAIIILSPSGEVPPELSNHAVVIDWPMPDREEIAAILDGAIRSLPDDMQASAAPNGTREAAIDAAVGLTGEEAASCYSKSIVQTRRIDPVAVAKEKRRVISREKVLEWFDPLPGGLDAVGGLEDLKDWLKMRATAYSPAAREYGLPSPKGCGLIGIPGCGKSMTAKAIATAWGVPLLRFDIGALKSKFVGDSEQNLRKAFRVIEAIGRCVVWFDEIEKALQGATSGSSDGGVSSDALGAILSWMQDRKGDAFVIMTANKAEDLPPELLRKGRLDELWWIDVPTHSERIAILAATLRSYGRGKLLDRNETDTPMRLEAVSDACADFTGSEVAELIPTALYAAFADNMREPTAQDLINAAKKTVPLVKQSADKIAKMRLWAEDKTRRATAPDRIEAIKTGRGARVLDV